MQRDNTLDLLKGLAIATVVIGHIEGFRFTLVPVYSFHMPLFFFISGWFYSEESSKDTVTALGGLVRNLVLPTLAVILFYSLVQAALNHFGIMPDHPNLAAVFKFGTKLLDTYWYIGCYFCVYLYFYAVHRPLVARLRILTHCRTSTAAAGSLLFYSLVAAGCLRLALNVYGGFSPNEKWTALAGHEDLVLMIRPGFGAFFYYLGSFCALMIRVRRLVFSRGQLAAMLLIGFAACRVGYYLTGGHPEFSVQIMYFPNGLTPVLTSLGGIALMYAAAHLLAGLRLPAGLLARLGRESFSIMSHHIFAFLLLNLLLLSLGLADRAQLDDPYFKWRPEDTHLLYLAVGLAYPVFFSWLVRKMSGNLGRKIQARNADGGL